MGNSPATARSVGYDEFQRSIQDRDAFFTRLGKSATINDVQNSSGRIVYEVKCIGEGHPELFRDQSYVLKALFNYGVTTTSVQNAFENEYIVSSTLEPHPNINRYFCHFTDRIPPEYYHHLPTVAKELAFDPVQKRMHACVWVVLEHHSETLEQLSRRINSRAPKLGPHTTPWPIVHKYSRDICAALVHLFVNQTIHFDIKLDNIVVSSNKEQVILIDLGCATKFPRTPTRRQFEIEMVSLISVAGNTSHRAPEIINKIARHRQNPDHSSTLCCDKQPSFELGCILFELAMCGKHPLPGYPGGYGPSGNVTFSIESEELFPMKSPQFPKEFCDLVRSLLQFDPNKRMPLLDAFEVLLNIEPPSPSELLSFYSSVVPLTNDAGTLTSKAVCQILCGSSTVDCVDTLNRALDVEPSFSPALLLLHYLSSCQHKKIYSRNKEAVQASLRGKTASFTATDVGFTRAIINKKHRNTLPELVLTALWARHISCDAEGFHNTTLLLLKKDPESSIGQEQHHQQVTSGNSVIRDAVPQVSIFLRSVIYTRNEMMMEALVQLQVGNIDSALGLVENALFDYEIDDEIKCNYLPGLLFLVCLCLVFDDHVTLHQHIPTCLSLAFSHAISFSLEEMREHCMRVLHYTSEKEWAALVSTASLRTNMHQQSSPEEQSWSCMFFVGLWSMLCCSSYNHQQHPSPIFEMSAPMMTHSVGQIHPATLLGLCYYFGLGCVSTNTCKAVTLYQTAAYAGHAGAMCNLALCYFTGKGVDRDIHKAVTLWQRAADAGHATAMYNLGVCYKNGYGVEKDMHKAVILWQRAADAGHATAMYNLGVCYENGDGAHKDAHKAVTLYQRATDVGDTKAMRNLAACYYNGDGVGKDLFQAFILHRRAAMEENQFGPFHIGKCKEKGIVEVIWDKVFY
ncbi:sel1 repeat family protein [Pelomyxa schiedti]|nr:sel1 repeat family protein [Pelomyxa schiedti]